MRKNRLAKNCAIIIQLAFLLAACAPTTTTTPIPPTAALRLIPTFTQTPAYKLGLTPKPTKTPKPGPTRTSVPTYTPATLSQFDKPSAYQLREWTVDQADLMIAQISTHLKEIEGDYVGARGRAPYREQFLYLALAEAEALMRFPDAPQAETWRWDVCYNWAVYYYPGDDTTAPELACYAKLIEDGLNSRQTNPSKLAKWFKEHEARLSFEIAAQTPPQGYTRSHIITIQDDAILWLVEKNGKFQVTGLISDMFYYTEAFIKFQMIDLTGDQFPELILYVSRANCCGAFSFQFIYDVSSGTPKPLTIASQYGSLSNLPGDSYAVQITKLEHEAMPGFVFKSRYGDRLSTRCDLREYDKYYWNKDQFEWVETWYGIEPPDQYHDKDLCQFAINTPVNQNELNVIANTIYGPASRQVISFRLGEYYAQRGNYDKAYHFFSDVATAAPSDEFNAKWIDAAKTLLEHYKNADDFYLACAKVIQCDLRSIVQQAIEKIQPALFPTVSEVLKAIGVQVKDSGILDFDDDGSPEQWLVIQHPDQSEREFWVLVKNNKKIDALFVTDIPSDTPVINEFVSFNQPSTIELETPSGKILFSLHRLNLSGQTNILRAHTPYNADDENEQIAVQNDTVKAMWSKAVDDAATAMLTGTDPATVKEILLKLKQSRNLDCKIYSCDQLYYFLGLANELTGDQPSAIDVYLQLWKDYPDSIYTIMARSKLEQAP